MKVRIQTSLAVILIVLSLFSIWISVMGCAQLRPGQDPLVVRAEQVEATAKATFDLLLNIDHSDRGFWRTNAAAFHSFCEWLRAPQIVWITNTLPRASAMIASLDDIKQDYVWARQSSNALVTAIMILQSASTEAGNWAQIVTNRNAISR